MSDRHPIAQCAQEAVQEGRDIRAITPADEPRDSPAPPPAPSKAVQRRPFLNIHQRNERLYSRAIHATTLCKPCRFASVSIVSRANVMQKGQVVSAGQEILSPLRLPVPPRPLWSPDQRLSAFSDQVE